LLLVCVFGVPILGVLYYSVDNPLVGKILPRTTDAMANWDGEALPDETAFTAFGEDAKEAYKAKTIARAALRLNYEIPGFRSMTMKAARKLKRFKGSSFKEALIAHDKRWGDVRYWRAIKEASAGYTPRYLLAAVDLKLTWEEGLIQADENRRIYLAFLTETFWISAVVVLLCVALGYPIAYLIATSRPAVQRFLFILVLIPFWTSLLVRTAAWVVLLQNQGMVNSFLIWLGVTDKPFEMIFNRFGVYVAMVHILLPFMVLPLYSVMKSISTDYMRAAASLGARPFSAFLSIYLPQTIPGLGAGCLLVFVISLGFYITPALVGGRSDQMVASLIAEFALGTANWGMAAALAVVVLVCVAAIYPLYHRFAGGDRMKLN
jgi:putative spermidine/putrescine transport system permease protein